jgi:hypothetical protein
LVWVDRAPREGGELFDVRARADDLSVQSNRSTSRAASWASDPRSRGPSSSFASRARLMAVAGASMRASPRGRDAWMTRALEPAASAPSRRLIREGLERLPSPSRRPATLVLAERPASRLSTSGAGRAGRRLPAETVLFCRRGESGADRPSFTDLLVHASVDVDRTVTRRSALPGSPEPPDAWRTEERATAQQRFTERISTSAACPATSLQRPNPVMLVRP